jgi:hypothetical protein
MSDCSDDFMVEDEDSDGSDNSENNLENSYYNAKAKLPDPEALEVLT